MIYTVAKGDNAVKLCGQRKRGRQKTHANGYRKTKSIHKHFLVLARLVKILYKEKRTEALAHASRYQSFVVLRGSSSAYPRRNASSSSHMQPAVKFSRVLELHYCCMIIDSKSES
jgi:hypothetical protein